MRRRAAGPPGSTGRCRLVLASRSPRRMELFRLLDLDFCAAEPAVDESAVIGSVVSPRKKAELAALAKARWALNAVGADVAVAGDTIVVHRGAVLGKPSDRAEALEMLRSLRGKAHLVITGVAVLRREPALELTGHAVTRVVLQDYSEEEMAAYVDSGWSTDKAGAYGIQDLPFSRAARVSGCYLNVVGLPLCQTISLLRRAGVDVSEETEQRLPQACMACPLVPRRRP